MAELYAGGALLIGVWATLWYLVALVKQRNDVADVAWGAGFVLFGGYLLWNAPDRPLAWLLVGMVTVWGLRLSWHIHRRAHGRPEDPRYAAWRAAWGRHFYWRSYLQVFVLQGALLLVVAAPMVVAAGSPPVPLGGWAWAGAAVWLVGFLFQAVADRQLAAFVRRRSDPLQMMTTGLWRYSRHPNYFGEIVMWCGLFVMVAPLEQGPWAAVSPVTIALLLRYVSGVPMLEARYAGRPGYEAYKRRTSVLLPLPPRRD